MTHEDDDFKTLRRYSRQDAAAMLHTRDSRLKAWVTQDLVPHQRSGKPGPRQRGVWFTYDDIRAIGKLMPSLMTVRQANSRAEARASGQVSDIEHDRAEITLDDAVSAVSDTLSAEFLEAFSNLTSLRAAG